MLLINCPYCGVRDESEFHYDGEAHIARPTNMADISDDDFEKFFSSAKTRKVSFLNAGGICTDADAFSTRCATLYLTNSSRLTRRVRKSRN